MITTMIQGPVLVTVDTTSGGKTLVQLLAAKGEPLDDGLSGLLLIPSASGIYWAKTSASASSAPMPTSGVAIEIRKTEAALLKFYASNVGMTVLQFGPKAPQG